MRVMDRSAPDYPDDVTVYLVVNDFGKFGKAYVETDIAEADRPTAPDAFCPHAWAARAWAGGRGHAAVAAKYRLA